VIHEYFTVNGNTFEKDLAMGKEDTKIGYSL
jgi:hypothetical protein